MVIIEDTCSECGRELDENEEFFLGICDDCWFDVVQPREEAHRRSLASTDDGIGG